MQMDDLFALENTTFFQIQMNSLCEWPQEHCAHVHYDTIYWEAVTELTDDCIRFRCLHSFQRSGNSFSVLKAFRSL